MHEEHEKLSEADEIAALLPWYVSGKIGAEDKARIETYARSHPELAHQIALAREEADAVFAVNQAIPVPHAALDKFKERLAAQPSVRFGSSRFKTAGSSIVDRVGRFLDGLTPRQLAYAGITAALAIAVQAASIGALLNKPAGPGAAGYQTASGHKDTLSAGTFALVSFQPTATASGLSAFLTEGGLSVVDGPRAGGLFRVRLSDKVLSKTEADALIAKLKARADLVAFASAAPSSQ